MGELPELPTAREVRSLLRLPPEVRPEGKSEHVAAPGEVPQLAVQQPTGRAAGTKHNLDEPGGRSPAPAGSVPTPAFVSLDGAGTRYEATPELLERIRASTAAGGLPGIPIGFDDEEGDWRTAELGDPFAVLYLDWRQHDRISLEMIAGNARILGVFWRQKLALMTQGAAGAQILRKFGGPDRSEMRVRRLAERIQRAAAELGAPSGISTWVQETGRRAEERIASVLKPLVAPLRREGEVSQAKLSEIVKDAQPLGVSTQDAVAYLTAWLRQHDYRPADPAANDLLGQSWIVGDGEPDLPTGAEYLARAAQRRSAGNLRGAIADCSRSLAGDPSDCEALLLRARCRMDNQDHQAAISDFDAACRLRPESDLLFAPGTEANLADYVTVLKKEKRFFQCDELIARAPQRRGQDPLSFTRSEVRSILDRVQRGLEEGRECERVGNPEEAILRYRDVLLLAADCVDAQSGLQRCPPAPPAGEVNVGQDGAKIRLEWTRSPSRGDVVYRIYRQSTAPSEPAHPGRLLAETEGTVWIDSTIEPGRRYVYSVFSLRLGVTSTLPATSTPAVPTAEVINLRVEPDDGTVRAVWDLPSAATLGVRVVRNRRSHPLTLNDGELLLVTDPQRFVDSGLPNGRRVYYRIVCEYGGPDGQVIHSPGFTFNALPMGPPSAIRNLRAERGDGWTRLEWDEPEFGTVLLVRSDRRPAESPGALVAKDNVGGLGEPVERAGPNSCLDRRAVRGTVYYIPVTVAGRWGAIGKIIAVGDVPEVTGLQVNNVATEIRCTWTWPEGSSSAMVAWRPDRFPASAEDAGGNFVRITAGVYKKNGHLAIPLSIVRQDYYVSVFAGTERGGEEVFATATGPESRRHLPLGGGGVLLYTIQPVRKVFSIAEYELSLISERDLVLPEVILVRGKGDLEPMDSIGATEVWRKDGIQLAAGKSHVLRIDKRSIGSGRGVLRLFLVHREDYQRFDVKDPPAEDRRIR